MKLTKIWTNILAESIRSSAAMWETFLATSVTFGRCVCWVSWKSSVGELNILLTFSYLKAQYSACSLSIYSCVTVFIVFKRKLESVLHKLCFNSINSKVACNHLFNTF